MSTSLLITLICNTYICSHLSFQVYMILNSKSTYAHSVRFFWCPNLHLSILNTTKLNLFLITLLIVMHVSGYRGVSVINYIFDIFSYQIPFFVLPNLLDLAMYTTFEQQLIVLSVIFFLPIVALMKHFVTITKSHARQEPLQKVPNSFLLSQQLSLSSGLK